MIREAISKVVTRQDLTEKEMEEVMREIIEKRVSAEQTASFITALRMKGETPEEITGAARVFRDGLPELGGGHDVVCLDREEITAETETISRTTKEAQGTKVFNISTATALVAAGGGLKIAKYVRRSDSHLCGCTDVVEALGIRLDMTSTQLERCLNQVGLCFFYEPLSRNGLRHIAMIRGRMGIRTIFNLLEPLINPARARIQILGTYEPGLTEKMALVLKNLGTESGLVVHGEDTLDEISITGRTKVTQLKEGQIRSYFIQPEDFGTQRGELGEIRGGTGKQNAEIILKILRGERGARRDITILNAAAAFMIAGRANDFNQGIALARQSIDSRRALNVLETIREFTNMERTYLRNDHEAGMERIELG